MRACFKSLLVLVGIVLVSGCDQSSSDQLFTKVNSRTTGIDFKNTLRESEEFNVLNYGYFYNGGGVAIGDLNNDGLADLAETEVMDSYGD